MTLLSVQIKKYGGKVLAGFNDLATLFPEVADEWSDNRERIIRCNRMRSMQNQERMYAVSTTGWNDPELLKEWRRAWTEKVNEKFRECHMAARIDHRSYKGQGIDLIPMFHEGYEVRAMEKKGIKTVIRELNRAIRQFNEKFISTRSYGSKCPCCSGYIFIKGKNDLKSTHPQIAKEWSEKNYPLQLDEVNAKSRKNVWWHCKRCGIFRL